VAYNSEKIRTEANAKAMRIYIANGIKYAEDKSENAENIANTKGDQAINTANAAKSVADNTNSRVENIIAHNGDGTKDTEIVDMRYDPVTGETYETAGERMNNFSSSLAKKKKQIEDIVSVNAAEFETLNLAVKYATDNNIKKVFLGEKVYNIYEGIVTNGKSLKFVGNGAKIVQKADVDVFDTTGGFEFERTVTAIDNVTLDVSEESGGATPLARLTLSDITNLNVNDILFLQSLDKGIYEFAQIRSIDTVNKYVYLSSRTQKTYVNMTISKLRENTFSMEGVEFDTDNASETWKGSYVIARNYFNVSIDKCKVKKGPNNAFVMDKCFSYNVDKSIIANLRNRLTDQAIPNTGYGVSDSGSSNGVVSNCLFINNRHGFTTNGLSYNFKVINCTGYNCAGAAFDSHSNADKGLYKNCFAFGSYRGNRTDGIGFAVRATNVDIIDCTIEGCFKGIQLFEKFDVVKLINLKIYNTHYSGVDADGETANKKLVIDGCHFEVVASSSVVDVGNCNLEIKNTKMINRSAINNSLCLVTGNSKVKLKDVVMDMSYNTGTNGRFMTFNNGSQVKGEDIELLQGSANMNNLVTGNDDTELAATTVDLKKITGDFTIAGIYNVDTCSLDFESPTKKGAVIDTSISAPGSSMNTLVSQRSSDTIIYNLTASATGAALKYFVSGNFIGQRLLIKNVGATNSFVIDSTGTKIIMSANKTLAPKQCALFVWDGVAWNGL
jgi:hypothetical protein